MINVVTEFIAAALLKSYQESNSSFTSMLVERSSPGVFFAQSKHTNGTLLYSARVIPFKGSWIEFATDVNNVMYAYIDRKKKFPVTTLLRSIGYGTDKDILDLFGLSEEVEASDNNAPTFAAIPPKKTKKKSKKSKKKKEKSFEESEVPAPGKILDCLLITFDFIECLPSATHTVH